MEEEYPWTSLVPRPCPDFRCFPYCMQRKAGRGLGTRLPLDVITDHCSNATHNSSILPVFDRLQYAKTEGEGLGERIMCMTSAGGSAQSYLQTLCWSASNLLNNELYWHYTHVFQMFLHKKDLKILCKALPPSRLLWCLHVPDIRHVTLFPGLLLRFCILQAIKTWKWEWPGNETNVYAIGQFRCDGRTIQTTNWAVASFRKGKSVYNLHTHSKGLT